MHRTKSLDTLFYAMYGQRYTTMLLTSDILRGSQFFKKGDLFTKIRLTLKRIAV